MVEWRNPLPGRGTRTVILDAVCSSPCEYCGSMPFFAAHVDSTDDIEMLILKCPKCGEIKRLHRKPPNFRMDLKRARIIAEEGAM
jgi:RNase P subunit RPR2